MVISLLTEWACQCTRNLKMILLNKPVFKFHVPRAWAPCSVTLMWSHVSIDVATVQESNAMHHLMHACLLDGY